MMPEDLLVYKNKHFRVEQCFTCPIPGYLILSPIVQVRSFSEMDPGALSELGTTLALVTQALNTIIKPDRIYCVLFGEENNFLHFHIFPRTKWILEEYLKENSIDSEVVSGPLLLEWSRNKFKKISPEHLIEISLEEIIGKLRTFIKSV